MVKKKKLHGKITIYSHVKKRHIQEVYDTFLFCFFRNIVGNSDYEKSHNLWRF